MERYDNALSEQAEGHAFPVIWNVMVLRQVFPSWTDGSSLTLQQRNRGPLSLVKPTMTHVSKVNSKTGFKKKCIQNVYLLFENAKRKCMCVIL